MKHHCKLGSYFICYFLLMSLCSGCASLYMLNKAKYMSGPTNETKKELIRRQANKLLRTELSAPVVELDIKKSRIITEVRQREKKIYSGYKWFAVKKIYKKCQLYSDGVNPKDQGTVLFQAFCESWMLPPAPTIITLMEDEVKCKQEERKIDEVKEQAEIVHKGPLKPVSNAVVKVDCGPAGKHVLHTDENGIAELSLEKLSPKLLPDSIWKIHATVTSKGLTSEKNLKVNTAKIGLSQKKGVLFVKTHPPEASIELLDNEIKDFQQGIVLEPGEYRIKVAAENYRNTVQKVSLDAGQKRSLRVTLDHKDSSHPEANQAKAKKADSQKLQGETALKVPNLDFGDYHALVIGNNDYRYLNQLNTAENDAETVARILRRQYGFQVNLLKNAKRGEILEAISRLRRQLNPNDNLVIFYAGHGYLDKETGRGYWLPVNAKRNNKTNWLANDDVTSELKAIRAKHVMIIADSCYSGTLTRGIAPYAAGGKNYYHRLIHKKTRVALTSGDIEPVIEGYGEHSVFARYFIRCLKNNDGVISGAKLYSKLRELVMLNANQTPEYGDIRMCGHEGGDFLFVRKK